MYQANQLRLRCQLHGAMRENSLIMNFQNWAQNELRKIQERGNTSEANINPGLLKLFPPERIKRLQRKEIKAYAKAQDKKWNNFLKRMSQ